MKQKWILTGLMMGLLAVMPVHAKQPTPSDISEATVFFNQILHDTSNPYIAHLAAENLQKLQSPGSDPTPRRQVEVPLVSQMSSGLAVPVVLEKSVMATFMVDTGATYTVITPRLATKLGVVITPDTPRMTIATANGPIKAPMVKLHNVSLGGVEVSEVPVIVQDLGNNVLLAGLLGMSFFKDMDLTIKKDKLILSVSQAY